MASFTFNFCFIGIIVSETSGLIKRREKKRFQVLVVKWPTSNQPDPVGEEQKGSKQLCPTEAYWISKPCSSLKPRFGLQAKNEVAGAATELSASPCPPASVCAQSLRRYAYRQSSLGEHPRSCGSHSAREVLW